MEGGKIEVERGEEERMGNKRGRDEKGSMGRLEKRPSGMVVVEEYSGDEMINGVKYEEEKHDGGGLFNQLITNLVNSPSPRSNNKRGDDVFEAEPEKNGDDSGNRTSGGGGGGGVINNLISNIFSSSNGDAAETVGKVDGDGDGEEEKDGDKSAIDNIVSKLPRTLSEDAAPATTDEASILLHSIIHD